MQHWNLDAASANDLIIECVSFDEKQRPTKTHARPLIEYLRGLTVTLPVNTVITVDRPGAI